MWFVVAAARKEVATLLAQLTQLTGAAGAPGYASALALRQSRDDSSGAGAGAGGAGAGASILQQLRNSKDGNVRLGAASTGNARVRTASDICCHALFCVMICVVLFEDSKCRCCHRHQAVRDGRLHSAT